MYKIMLVDDEPQVLSAMVNTLKWNHLGFSTPITCSDGKDALSKLNSGPLPDAVITDICMPFMNGIDFTREIRKKYPSILVVMLTGYDVFPYAHEAIKLKVYDYLLKPVTPKQLTETVGVIKAELDIKNTLYLDKPKTLTRERFLCDLLTKNLGEKAIADSLRILKLPLHEKKFLTIAVDLDLKEALTAQQNRDNDLVRYELINIVSDLVKEYPQVYVCTEPASTCTAIISADTNNELLDIAFELSTTIYETANHRLNLYSTAGIGIPVDSLIDLRHSYFGSVKALNYRFFYGNKPYINISNVDIPSNDEFNYFLHEEQFLQCAESLNSESVKKYIDDFEEQLQKQKIPYDRCVRYCQKLIICLIRSMEVYLSKDSIKELEKAWDTADFCSVSNVGQLFDILRNICSMAFNQYELTCTDTSVALMMRVEAYLKEHYMDESLSLQTITEQFAISTSYFSSVFKSKTGCTFIEYLTQLRINQARHFLTHTARRSGEISQMVGFADPHYFSLTFKRVTGTTPREYRLAHKV